MDQSNYPENWADIDIKLYKRSARIFKAVKRILSVKLDMHADQQALQGDIFLFNHFSRFETFIPQYLIYEKTGQYSCAIASGEFFKEDTVLSRYLKHVGVFPHNHERLFELLAGQILRGRKVIIFPEGGMVKDRRVIDNKGEYSIYSRISGNRRKQHTGPAVLAQGVAIFKAAILHAFKHKNTAKLLRWKNSLQFEHIDQLLLEANKPTLIVPANITFYPIRSSENFLFQGVELFAGELNMRQAEELLIESNILLKNTDMDIRMGTPINPYGFLKKTTHYLINKVVDDIDNLDDVFKLNAAPKNWQERILGTTLVKYAQATRDLYMHEIYANVTVNLSHLASTLIMYCIEQGQSLIEKNWFYNILYIAIKNLQNHGEIYLHHSLINPDDYTDLLQTNTTRLHFFIDAAKDAGLIQERTNSYQFLPKLCAEYDFDRIRLENPIAVYSNEVAPLRIVRNALINAINIYATTDITQFAAWYFDDECRTLAIEKQTYSKPAFQALELLETATADPSPFIIQPEHTNGIGILLIHGLLASPAELKEYAGYLTEQGYTTLGIRLKGHGTSPYALRDQNWEDWYGSVQRGFTILKAQCRHIFVIGFSTGGALALKLAGEHHPEILGVVAVSVPILFNDPTFMLVTLLHSTNKLLDWISHYEGIKPFVENTPEHPHINYQHIPVRALYELRLLILQLETILPTVQTPSLILYADHDPIVSPNSASIIFTKLGASNKQLLAIQANRHGILMENLDNTWKAIDRFLIASRKVLD